MTRSPAQARRPTRRRWRAIVSGLLAGALACLALGLLTGAALRASSTVRALDVAAVAAATDVARSHPRLLTGLLVWQELFQPWRVHLACVPVLLWAWRRGLSGRTAWAAATMLLGWNLGLDLKLLVQRVRPALTDPIAAAPGYSFPSGHVFNVTVAASALLVLLWPLLRGGATRAAAATVAVAVVATTAADRVYLGVHYPSDVVAGAVLAAVLVATSWVLTSRTGIGHTATSTDGDISAPVVERRAAGAGGVHERGRDDPRAAGRAGPPVAAAPAGAVRP